MESKKSAKTKFVRVELPEIVQRLVHIEGKVQGVGFRAWVRQEAGRFPTIKGYVRNLDDGRVEVRASGASADVLALVSLCRQGPPGSEVTRLSITEEEVDPSLLLFQMRR